jgi:hypothetical protein
MIDKAQRKLREAQFFYRHLLKVQGGTGGDAEAFRFYFSAFIQAARSVTWAIGKEEKKKWKAWEPKWSKGLTPDQRKLKKFTNKLRASTKNLAEPTYSWSWKKLHLMNCWESVNTTEAIPPITRRHNRKDSQCSSVWSRPDHLP